MNIAAIMFYFFLATACIGSVGLIFIRHVFHGALLLIIVLLCIAGVYVLAFAEFMAVTQVLVYAGGILVVMIFGIMLTSKLSGKPLVVEHGNVVQGILVGICFFLLLTYFLSKESFNDVPDRQPTQITEFGIGILTDYALPFEIVGVVLLTALIGAAVIASASTTKRT